MSISAGTRLGPYEIVSALGAGGMGEVYKARDTRLDRIVAIKVLPASTAHDPDSRARFEREAKTISQLKHPHICTLYDVGTDAPAPAYLVMEYLEGETLTARIKKGPLPIEQALAYAIQIADALDKAHRQGIVHRDLKPGNIMLTKTGATLLDFGLAKIAPPANVTTMETLTAPTQSAAEPLTARGTILGTFQYMAPEQIEGQEADARADLWAFGCVLYEMVTARRPFEGKMQASLVGAILEREPTPMVELQPLSQPALGRLVRTCLAKNPDDRFQNAHDLWLQLQWIEEGGSAAGLPAPVIAHRKRRERTIWVAGALALAAIASTTAWLIKLAPAITNIVTRFTFTLPEGQQFSTRGHPVAIAPDGSKAAYIANFQIYLRAMSQLTAQPLAGTQGNPTDLVFSPDSQSIAYFANPGGGAGFTLMKIAVSGGAPVKLCATDRPFGLSWRNGTIVFGQNSASVHGIQAVADTGGTPRTLVTVDKKENAGQPQMLDDGRHLIFTLQPAGAKSWDEADIVVQTIDGGARKTLVHGGTDGRVVPDGYLLYATGDNLLAVAFDVRTLALRGGPVPVLAGVRGASRDSTGAREFAVSDTGALVYAQGPATEQRLLVWVDRQGHEQPIPAKPRAYWDPRVSPDGTRIVVWANDDKSENNLWVWDLAHEILTRLTDGARDERYPVWTPDSRRVVFMSGNEFRRAAVDGTGTPEIISPNGFRPFGVSPDGRLLVYGKVNRGTGLDLMVLPLDAGGQPRPLIQTKFNEYHAKISPDGRWIAYQSDKSGTNEIYVQPFPRSRRATGKSRPRAARLPYGRATGMSCSMWRRSSPRRSWPSPCSFQGRPSRTASRNRCSSW
jgi:Tol biopolymer transport system component